VRGHACADVADDRHENVKVFASHVGRAVNPSVQFVVADRLAQPERGWQPFAPPPWLRVAYPTATTWRSRVEPATDIPLR
jgi:hypothetical protein